MADGSWNSKNRKICELYKLCMLVLRNSVQKAG